MDIIVTQLYQSFQNQRSRKDGMAKLMGLNTIICSIIISLDLLATWKLRRRIFYLNSDHQTNVVIIIAIQQHDPRSFL